MAGTPVANRLATASVGVVPDIRTTIPVSTPGRVRPRRQSIKRVHTDRQWLHEYDYRSLRRKWGVYGIAASAAATLLTSLASCSPAHAGPAEVVTEFYQDLGRGETGKACDLLAEEMRSFVASVGQSCEAVLADDSDSDLRRAAMRDVKVDSSKVKTSGDTATIPNDAVTFRGSVEPGDGTIHLIRRGGDWLIIDEDSPT